MNTNLLALLAAAILLPATACTKSEPPATAEQPAADADERAAAAPAERDALTPPPVATGAPKNPLQAEMRALTAMMQVAVVAVANEQLELIPPAIDQLHGAMETTQAALKAGEIELPYYADDVEGFVVADKAFHEELVGLLQAARTDDTAAAANQVGVLLQGCVSCHARYRFPAK